MAFPRKLPWTSTLLMLLAVAACQKSPNPSARPTSAPEAAKQTVSAEPTSFGAVARHLDRDGGLYLFLSTEQFLKTAAATLGELQSLFLENVPVERRAEVKEGWEYVSRIVSRSGLNEISGFGISSIAVEPGFYQTKWMLHHYEGKANGLLWKLNGGASDALEILPWLPERTAFVTSGDFSLQPVWDLINQETAGKPELRQGIDQISQQLEVDTGLKLAELIASVGPRYAIVVTLDTNRPTTLPSGSNGESLTFPEPGAAIFIQVRDPALLARVEQELSKIPGVVSADEGDLKLRSIPVPLPMPFLRPSVAWQEDTLILSSNEALIREMFEVKGGKKAGLAAVADFKEVIADLPAPVFQFKAVAPSFQRTVLDLQTAATEQQSNAAPEVQRLMQSFASFLSDRWACSVVQSTPEGWVGFSRSAAGPTQLATFGTVVPVAVLAGVAAPAFSVVMEKGKQTRSLADAKQVFLACKMYAADHQGSFPSTLEQLVPDYISDTSTVAGLLRSDAVNNGFHYFGGKDTDAPDKVLLVGKAVGKNKMRAVITVDGSGSLKRVGEDGVAE